MNGRKETYLRAVEQLHKPGAKLVLTFTRSHQSGKAYCILPEGIVIAEETAKAILRRPDLKVVDVGLLPNQAQSWRLGNG